ncbi:MAG: hypothetical protein H8F28_08485 [Fibrella sp.]|nr:hypothetical protein [Armatimonadota bacterium]
MGLEIVGLIMSVEERFDIEIADADVEKFVTVGDMYEHLCGIVNSGEMRRVCENLRTFHRVRKVLMRTAEVPRWYVRPTRRLDHLLSVFPAKRKLALRRLQNEIGVRINADPDEVVTVGAVVRLAVAQSRSTRKYGNDMPIEGWNRVTIWQALHELIVTELSVKPGRVMLSARFIEDLDCG